MAILRSRAWYFRVLPMAARTLNWPEEKYRDLLRDKGAKIHQGHYSAATMGAAQLAAALVELERAGFKLEKPKRGAGKPAPRGDWRRPRIALITRLWNRLVELGEIRSPDPDQALLTWCKTKTNSDRLEWATSEGLNEAVEALKMWRARAELKAKRGCG